MVKVLLILQKHSILKDNLWVLSQLWPMLKVQFEVNDNKEIKMFLREKKNNQRKEILKQKNVFKSK